jgi:hypothetical protein
MLVVAPVRGGSNGGLEISLVDAGAESWFELTDLPAGGKLCFVLAFGSAKILSTLPPPEKNVVVVRLANVGETSDTVLDEAAKKVETFLSELVKAPAGELDLHPLTKDFPDVRIWRFGPVRIEDPPVGRPHLPLAHVLLDRNAQRTAAEKACDALAKRNGGGVICALVPGRVPSEVRLIGEHIREHLVRERQSDLIGYASVSGVLRYPVSARELKERIVMELKGLAQGAAAVGDLGSLVGAAVGARSRQSAILILDWLDFPSIETPTEEWLNQARDVESAFRTVFEDAPLSRGAILLNVIGIQLHDGDLSDLRTVLSRPRVRLDHYRSAVYPMMKNPEVGEIGECLDELDSLLRKGGVNAGCDLWELADKIFERHGGVFHATAKEIDRCGEEGWDVALERLRGEVKEMQS